MSSHTHPLLHRIIHTTLAIIFALITFACLIIAGHDQIHIPSWAIIPLLLTMCGSMSLTYIEATKANPEPEESE